MDCGNRDTKCGDSDGDSCAAETRGSGNWQTPLTPLPRKLESSWHQDNSKLQIWSLLSHPAAWDTVHSNEMIRWNENIIYTQCCDVWRVTGCVTRHISIRCETRGMGYVITTLHSPHSLTQTVSQPASSPALTLRMSKCQFHFILFYENWRTLLVASLVFYWDSPLYNSKLPV